MWWQLQERRELKKVDKKVLNKGKQEGREETKIEIALSCIQQGLDTETIMAITQLSREDIEALRLG
ncbi:MAG: hypothetical protein F6J96_30935 [Symploca sp. SIO1C2]|nr:hypothetical protein [Symploca sp. SIO1C2]